MSRPSLFERVFCFTMAGSLAVGAVVLVGCLSVLGIEATYRSIAEKPLQVVRCTKTQLQAPTLSSECVEWSRFDEPRKP